jgi:hypothetical protein
MSPNITGRLERGSEFVNNTFLQLKRKTVFCDPSFLHGEGPRSRCYGETTVLRFLAQPNDEDEDEQLFYQVLQVMEHQWNEIDRGKPTTRRKTCPSATLSTTIHMD